MATGLRMSLELKRHIPNGRDKCITKYQYQFDAKFYKFVRFIDLQFVSSARSQNFGNPVN